MAAALACTEPPVSAAWQPELGSPRLDSTGVIRWVADPQPVSDDIARWRDRIPPDSASDAIKVAAWRGLAEHPSLGLFALRRLALSQLDAGDRSGADSTWARIAATRGLWMWDAVRSRSDLAATLGETARADSLLEATDRSGWPDGERAAWLNRRVRLRLALGDTAGAVEFSRQAIRRYPTLPVTARVLAVFDSLVGAGQVRRLPADDRFAAEVNFWSGQRGAGAARLARAFERWQAADRWQVGVRRAEMLRQAGQLDDARRALAVALQAAVDARGRERVALERGRVERDAGRADRAAVAYAQAAVSADTVLRETARWERARAAEALGRWVAARDDYDRVARLGAARREDAAFRSGLMSIALGDRAGALARMARVSHEGARFWHALLDHSLDSTRGTDELQAIASLPGYTFYRACARDSLHRRGWPGALVAVAAGDPGGGALALAGSLLGAGLWSDAMTIVDRWAAGDSRAGALPDRRDPAALLEGARLAYGGGRMALGIQLASRALEAAGPGGWPMAPWVAPPAFDSLFAAFPESSASGVDRSLLRAVAWQESRFDPMARSRSQALGLLQLKLATAGDVARLLHEPPPDAQALLDPARNLRFGSNYFERQMARFDGDVALALAAYNAGPAAVTRWKNLAGVARGRIGGDALEVELIAIPEAEDYVKKILAVRQAYRELRPLAAKSGP